MTGQQDDLEKRPLGERRTLAVAAIFTATAVVAWLLDAPIGSAVGAGLAAGTLLWLATIPELDSPRPRPVEPAAPPSDLETPSLRAAELIAAIDDPMMIIDGQRIAFANTAAEAIFGEERLKGDFRLALRHPAAADMLASPFTDPPSSPIELVGIGAPDKRWLMSVHKLPDGVRLVRLRDRTDTWAAERMRVDFVANASHELRTPLATLLGFIETLSDASAGADEAIRQRFLGIMLAEAKRMQQLVDDLMSLSRIEADRFSTPQTPIALAPVIEEVANVIRSGQRDEGGRIALDIGDVADVRADRVQIAQLLHNLIGNAIKYGRPGTPIRVALEPVNGKVRLQVTDQGEGIAPEHLPRLTERFYRVDAGRSRAVGGTGLGLAIVKHIVERHRATFGITSKLGEGTVVTVTFPPANPT
ncbi:PAS domain-containing protein [Sphingomonas montanisoli]|uniref:histidine kinase n=1 Tax=Sphingomonas montanisoli TaxID=2606412 RepID=A0A5D9CF50_9SPHN|nr:PAS domain-containing protein [Sphingomonas montanisoli]